MNRKERRMLDKVREKEQNEFLIKNVRSIYNQLDITENLIEMARKDIVKVEVPKSISKVCKESAETLENFRKDLYGIREIFLHDEKCKNGFVKKCVVNALEVPMYKVNLDEFVNNVRKNKRNGTLGLVDYLICHDLSSNKIEVRRTLDVLEQALPVMIANLKANNVTNKIVGFLVANLATLERRLYQLYCLYGRYLEDIGNIVEYQLIYQLFDKFDTAFANLIGISNSQ